MALSQPKPRLEMPEASRGSEQLFLVGRCGISSGLCKASVLVPDTSKQDLLGNGPVVKTRPPVFIGDAVLWNFTVPIGCNFA